MKDVTTSVDIALIIPELTEKIVGKRIDNIYHILPETFIFRLRPGDLRLLIEVERRIHLTQYDYPTPQKPSNICMALRKHLVGGVIENIQQYEFERIIELKVSTGRGPLLLVAEVFRRGNLILVGPDKKIILSLRYARMRDREVVRNVEYRPAPPSGLNPLKMDLQKLQNIREAGKKSILKTLTSLISIGPTYSMEILLRAGVSPETESAKVENSEILGVIESFKDLIRKIVEKDIEPRIIFDEDNIPIDVIPFPLKTYENKPFRKFISFNEAVDEYFSALTTTLEIEKAKSKRLDEESRLSRILREQDTQRRLLEETVKEDRARGELIYSNLHLIQEFIGDALKMRKAGLAIEEINENLIKKASSLNIVFKPKMENESFTFEIGGLHLKIMRNETPQQAAQRYYESAKKSSEKLKRLKESMRMVESKIKNLSSKVEAEELKVEVPKLRRVKAWYEKFSWFKSSDGILVISGKDASTNELLVRRYMEEGDIVMHAEIHGAPFTVIKAGGNFPPDSTLTEAAQVTASRSKAWSLGLAAVDVYWVKPEQVTSKAPSGEYLGRGQFMVTGKRNYIRGVELRMAIGLQKNGEEIRFIAGAPSAIKRHSETYVELVPGKTPAGKLARKIIEILKPDIIGRVSERTLKSMVEEVARLIPAGRADILSRGRIIS
ncbi:MAG: ribosome rescue protein RqcH [Candidatus Bathyarchaeia archaeon]